MIKLQTECLFRLIENLWSRSFGRAVKKLLNFLQIVQYIVQQHCVEENTVTAIIANKIDLLTDRGPPGVSFRHAIALAEVIIEFTL